MMRFSIRAVAVGLLVAALSGCKQDDDLLAQAAQLGKLSADTRSTVNALAADVYQSCIRANTLTVRGKTLASRTLTERAGFKREVEDACTDRKAYSDEVVEYAKPVFAYLDAVAALGNYKPPTVDTAPVFKTFGASKDASGYYSQIFSALTSFTTAKWRVGGLRTQVPKLNGAFQGAVATLQSAFLACGANRTITYPGVLDAEDANARFVYAAILADVVDLRAAPSPPPLVDCPAAGNPPISPPQSPAALPKRRHLVIETPAPGSSAAPHIVIATPAPSAGFRKRGRPQLSPVPSDAERAIQAQLLETFDRYNTELAATYETIRKQRAASELLVRALHDLAIAHQALSNALGGLPPPCGPAKPPPQPGAPAPAPTAMCTPLDPNVVKVALESPAGGTARAAFADAAGAVRDARRLISLH